MPGIWVRKATLKAVLVSFGRYVARLGNRRLGPYEVLFCRKCRSGYLLLRGAAGEAAAALPPTPSAAELAAAAAAASYESEEEEEEEEGAPPEAAASARQAAASLRQQGPSAAAAAASAPPLPTTPTASAHGLLPPALAPALAALPPPGPGDAKPKERRALLRGALPAGALPTLAQLPEAVPWVLRTGYKSTEVMTACAAVRFLRVRSSASPPATLPSLGAHDAAPRPLLLPHLR